jgi:hypothetical protein
MEYTGLNSHVIAGFFYVPQICNVGLRALPLIRRKAGWGLFRPKNPTTSAGFAPANLGIRSQHAICYTTEASTALPCFSCTNIWPTLYRSSEAIRLPCFVTVILAHRPTHCTVNVPCLFSPPLQMFFTRCAVDRWPSTLNIFKFLSHFQPGPLFEIFAHPVFKMWITRKPNKVALWNKRHFEERKAEIMQHVFKIFSTDICWINI